MISHNKQMKAVWENFRFEVGSSGAAAAPTTDCASQLLKAAESKNNPDDKTSFLFPKLNKVMKTFESRKISRKISSSSSLACDALHHKTFTTLSRYVFAVGCELFLFSHELNAMNN
jgi:hypothetical protein